MGKRLPGLTPHEFASVDLELAQVSETLLRLARLLREAFGEDWLNKGLVQYRHIDRFRQAVKDQHDA